MYNTMPALPCAVISQLEIMPATWSASRTPRRTPVIVDSDELVRRPAGVLRALCHALGLPVSTEQLGRYTTYIAAHHEIRANALAPQTGCMHTRI